MHIFPATTSLRSEYFATFSIDDFKKYLFCHTMITIRLKIESKVRFVDWKTSFLMKLPSEVNVKPGVKPDFRVLHSKNIYSLELKIKPDHRFVNSETIPKQWIQQINWFFTTSNFAYFFENREKKLPWYMLKNQLIIVWY